MSPVVALGETLSAVETALAKGAPYIWIAQLAECWILDPNHEELAARNELDQWRQERREIDARLLNALLRGKVLGIRRAVLYDVSSDAGVRFARPGADPDIVHQRIYRGLAAWKQDLARYVALVDDGTANRPLEQTTALLSIQMVILGRVSRPDAAYLSATSGSFDGCLTTTDPDSPATWRQMARMISLHGDLGIPAEDADPLAAIPSVELLEYRRQT